MRWLIVLMLVAWPAAALAEPEIAVTGDNDAGVLKAVKKALDKKATIVGEDDAAAIVRIAVVRGKKKWTAVVTAVQVADGKRIAKYEVKAKKSRLAKATAAKAWAKLGKALKKAKKEIDEETPVAVAEEPPPPEPEPEPEPEPVEQPDPEPDRTPKSKRTAAADTEDGISVRAERGRGAAESKHAPWLELSAEGRPFLRTLRYNDDIMGALRDYDLAAPAAAVTATWRPLPKGGMRFLSLHGEVELAVGVNGSRTSDGTEYATKASEWTAGLRGDFPIAGWRWTLDAAYGEHRFSVDDNEMTTPLVPDTTYRWARGGLGVRIPVGAKLAVAAGGGYRHLLDMGDLESDAWFPRVTGSGIDAEAGIAWRVGGPVTLDLRGDLRRYFFAMNPEVGDALVVGGAVDQYIAIIAGVTVSLR